MIRFLLHNEIDLGKWDSCVRESQQKLIYGMSWYLDLVSPGWCGLEEDDYSSIMPLPVKKKYGINYIIQPLFAQQLGVFSKNKSVSQKIREFISAIPEKYKFIALNFNHDNEVEPDFASVKMNNNFELLLNRDYPAIAAAYSDNNLRNIQKAKSIRVHFDSSSQELIQLKTENTGANRRKISPQVLNDFTSAILGRGAGFVCSASIDNRFCASVFFLLDDKRIYYLIPVSNPLGKEKKAMFAIIDAVIHKYAGSPMILDFEGSNIPGLARFFGGFGADNHPYPALKINCLPFPLNQFRKS